MVEDSHRNWQLINIMDEAGLTVAELVRQGISRTQVHRLRNGENRWPHSDTYQILVRVLRDHDVVVAGREQLGFTRGSSDSAFTITPEEPTMVDQVRRGLVALAAATFYGVSTDTAHAVYLRPRGDADRKVGASDVARVVSTRDRIFRTGCMYGSAMLSPVYMVDEFRGAAGLTRGRFRDDDTRTEAVNATVALGQVIAMELFDQGDVTTSRRIWLTCLHLLRETHGSLELQADVIDYMAWQCIYLGQPRQALDLLGMMHGREGQLHGSMVARLDLARANAAAMIPDARAVHRYVSDAQDRYAECGDRLWNHNGWFNLAKVSSDTGRALATLATHHEPDRDDALGRLTGSLNGFGPERNRATALTLPSIVRIHAARRDADATMTSALAALDANAQLKSTRVARQLHYLIPDLQPLHRNKDVREIMRRIEREPLAARTEPVPPDEENDGPEHA